MIRLRLVLWWTKYHWLSLAHILQPSAAGRIQLHGAMTAHDKKHPTGDAPKW